MTDVLWKCDATALLAAYRAGDTTPSAVMAETLARIAERDPGLGAYSILSGTAEAEAAAATARWRNEAPSGPLDGVPLIVKDNLASAGLPAAWGNAVLCRRVCAADEIPVLRLRAAGAIVVGKGNCPEFAVEGYTANATFGVTRNPFDPARTPGGSSGGVVTALAAGLATIGIATDGGGSIRRPAGYCGLFGLKPGIGHVPRGGGLAQILLDFEVAGSDHTVGPRLGAARYGAFRTGPAGPGITLAGHGKTQRAAADSLRSHTGGSALRPGYPRREPRHGRCSG